MNKSLCSVEEVESLINNNRVLLLAGDETVLDKLPDGNWIAGTIPYFMAPEGSMLSKEKIHVTDLTDKIADFKIKTYDKDTIAEVVNDEFENGFSVIILPALQPVWESFALNSPSYPDLYTNPLIGWVSGVEFSEFGKISPKTYSGNKKSESLGVVMHLDLPENMLARVDIINVYEPGEGDVITFPNKGFDSGICTVNGKEQSLYKYFSSVNANEQLPLVANYSGAHLNVGSIWNRELESANIFAPVFPNVEYKLAKSTDINYEMAFEASISKEKENSLTFSCNCLMNYFTFGLEGKKLQGISGPITFGEIAYQILNQTFVYLVIEEK